jgi:Leu/Phe-tRNA-protein transferase
MNIHLIIVLFSIFFIGCSSANTQTTVSKDPALQEFARMLIGEFSSKEQSLQDTTYLNIHLSRVEFGTKTNQQYGSMLSKQWMQKERNHIAKECIN